jgi:hypothetical protein
MRTRTLAAIPITAALVSGVLTVTGPASSTPATPARAAVADVSEAPLYRVLSEGMTAEQAKELADRAGIKAALRPDGSFGYVDPQRFSKLPTLTRRASGRDEDGHRTVAQRLDVKALKATEVLGGDHALRMAAGLLDVPRGFDAQPRVDHTLVERSGVRGRPIDSTPIDTSVSYDLSLDGVPVVGPGSRSRIAFAADGSVLALTQAVRAVGQAGWVTIINPEEAAERCAALYGPSVEQGAPRLVYFSPALSAVQASGQGRVSALFPHYECSPSGVPVDRSQVPTGRLLPAVLGAPSVVVKAAGDGSVVTASTAVHGGTEPFSVRWSSATSTLPRRVDETLEYELDARGELAREVLTATVTDVNGLIATASVVLPRGQGEAVSEGFGGAGGALASVGIEQTVDEWQCAQDSANGFRSVMQSKGQAVSFDWRGVNAWEQDFKKTSAGGDDDSFVDAVDAQWYTGHGWSGGFTFKGSNDDGDITPSDARWGDNVNLEWMLLESCQVLRDTNGSNDYFSRWAPAFDGLHVLNGFDTNAYCINGGTGRRYAEYLFPTFWRGPLSVTQAWSAMANDLEPSGVRWRSVSAAGQGWVHNLNDRYWGQGSTGPDIPASQRIGFIAISGVV